VWAVSGATAGLVGVLQLPFGVVSVLSLNGFQLSSFAAALVGGFASLPAVVAGGLGLGIGREAVAALPSPLSGLAPALAPLAILVLLLAGVERFFVSDQEARAVEGDARAIGAVRRPVVVGSPRQWLVGSLSVVAVTFALSGFWTFVATRTAVYALLGLSLVVLTGWAGQVSLMPGTFAGVGACLAWLLGTRLGFPFVITVPLAALATVPVSAVAGIAALRLRPLYLAVATVALAGLFEETLFVSGWFANGGANLRVARPAFVAGDHAYAAFVFVVGGAVFAASAALARSRTGRVLRMVRDNPTALASSGLNPVKYRLVAFAISAGIAGLAGALLAYLVGAFSTELFSLLILSLATFGVAAVGGLASPLGAVIGAFGFVWLTEIFRTSGGVSDLTTLGVGAGIVAVMSLRPDGLVGFLSRRRLDDLDEVDDVDDVDDVSAHGPVGAPHAVV
jgi:ABC-type branched-subunit amino acid transport system permease subunit